MNRLGSKSVSTRERAATPIVIVLLFVELLLTLFLRSLLLIPSIFSLSPISSYGCRALFSFRILQTLVVQTATLARTTGKNLFPPALLSRSPLSSSSDDVVEREESGGESGLVPRLRSARREVRGRERKNKAVASRHSLCSLLAPFSSLLSPSVKPELP